MSFLVQLTDDAAGDLEEICDYIDRHDGPGRADHVLEQIEERFNLGIDPGELAGSAHLEHPVILHESPDIHLELIQATETNRGIPAIYVEKDYRMLY